MAFSNPLTADHVGNGRHAYIPMGVGSEALSLFGNERHVFIPSSRSQTMGVCGQGAPLLSTWKALLTFTSLTWCLAGEKTTMGCLDG